MVSKKSRSEIRVKKHTRLRNRFAGTAERPRLAVFRSNNHMYAQIIDDTVGNTLVAASTNVTEIRLRNVKSRPKFQALFCSHFRPLPASLRLVVCRGSADRAGSQESSMEPLCWVLSRDRWPAPASNGVREFAERLGIEV